MHVFFIEPEKIGIILKTHKVTGAFNGIIILNQLVKKLNPSEGHVAPKAHSHIFLKKMGKVRFINMKFLCNNGDA